MQRLQSTCPGLAQGQHDPCCGPWPPQTSVILCICHLGAREPGGCLLGGSRDPRGDRQMTRRQVQRELRDPMRSPLSEENQERTGRALDHRARKWGFVKILGHNRSVIRKACFRCKGKSLQLSGNSELTKNQSSQLPQLSQLLQLPQPPQLSQA